MHVYFDKEIPFPEEIQIGDAGKLDLVKGKNCFYTYILFASCINSLCQVLHYENTSIQIYRKFHLQKLKIFRYKNSNIFHISAQNIDCGYSLEPPR